MQNGKPEAPQPQVGEGIIELPVEWRRLGKQYEVKLQNVRFANVQGGWEVVIDMLIAALSVARNQAKVAAQKRITLADRLPGRMMN